MNPDFEVPSELRDRIPKQLYRGLSDYVLHHIATGSFLRAVLENDLLGACHHAHPESKRCFFDIVYVLSYAPAACFGSPENVAQWLADRPRPGVPAEEGSKEDA